MVELRTSIHSAGAVLEIHRQPVKPRDADYLCSAGS